MKKTTYIFGYILGVFLIMLSLVTFCYGCYTSNILGDTPMNRITVPGENLIAFDQPGKYVIYQDYTYDDIYSDDEYYDDDSYYDDDFTFNFDDLFPNEDDDNPVLSNLNFSLINKETNEKILIYNCKADNDYNIDYENGEAIFEFYIKDPGAYIFSMTSNDESTTDKYTMTILKNEDNESGNFLLFSAASLALLVLGVLLITCISVNLFNDKHNAKISSSNNIDNINDPYDRFSHELISYNDDDNTFN
ncbi:Hypothetical protein CM240_0878 [Clostridium bornimense]|uniref:Uncharacterized protein n=1 Tax=Clostridium bornimense TaxID=1216932 RepID=W6S178_9CLOT|nr:hypothetical protein [Clostridium bornimense]CDM68042.1 Hypothetical protein CM240_0878 [Clostridium bornimense]